MSKRPAPAKNSQTTLRASFAGITAHPETLNPASRVGRGGGMQQLVGRTRGYIRFARGQEVVVEVKSPYWFVGEETTHKGVTGHFCLIQVTKDDLVHGGNKYCSFIGSTHLSNIKSHFKTWHKKVP